MSLQFAQTTQLYSLTALQAAEQPGINVLTTEAAEVDDGNVIITLDTG